MNKKYIYLLSALWLGVGLTTSSAASYYADVSSATPLYPYTNWTIASTSVVEAVDALMTEEGNGNVYVADGVYFEQSTLMITSTYTTIRSMNGPAFTTIHGNNHHRCLYMNKTATFQGFTLTGGSNVSQGAGVYIDSDGYLSDCIIVSNGVTGTDGGGGAYLNNGGTLDRCTVAFNTAPIQGGGVQITLNGTMKNCLVTENRANYGGGVFCYRGGLLENCTITYNTANTGGGGLRNDTAAGGALTLNSIIYYNTPDNYSGAAPMIFSNCCAPDAITQAIGTDNIETQPLFLGRDQADYHLSMSSPCLDAGLLRYGKDLDGNTRPLNGATDIGAYEFNSPTVAINFMTTNRSGTAPFACEFTTAYVGYTNIFHYKWDFESDGSWNLEGLYPQATNTYTIPGIYTVTVYAINSDGLDAWRIKQDYITVYPPTAYVATNGNHMAPFLSWADAATNVQAALDIVGHGGRVLVSNGVYEITHTLTISNSIELLSMNGASATIFDACYPKYTNRVLSIPVTGVVVEGFSLCGGRAALGGGVYLVTNSILSACSMYSNTASADGGGCYLDGGCISNCLLYNNSANRGGGVFFNRTGSVQRCTIITNMAGSGGGTWHYIGGVVEQTLIASNYSASYGGGSYIDRRGYYNQCLIYDNYTAAEGGGVYMSRGGELSYCTIATNRAFVFGGGVSCLETTRIEHCIIYYNHDSSGYGNFDNTGSGQTYTNNCMTPTLAGNITNAPLFTDIHNRQFYLLGTSACIDAGLSNHPVMYDFQGAPRPMDGNNDGITASDIGCYEYLSSTADTDADGLSDRLEWSNYKTSPLHEDTDADGVSDSNEVAAGMNPLYGDSDYDGIGDSQEYSNPILDPLNEDTDGDGLLDGYELDNPFIWTSQPVYFDTDGDGLSDGWEYIYQTNPGNRDYDYDGVEDGAEVIAGTNPRSNTDFFHIAQLACSNGICISWNTRTNRSYHMQYATNLSEEVSWLPLTTQPTAHGNNENITVTNPTADQLHFYRIQVTHP